jgi:hypothetical protein
VQAGFFLHLVPLLAAKQGIVQRNVVGYFRMSWRNGQQAAARV